MTERRILVILDGAAEPVWPWASTLEEAHVPALDALCARGAVARVVTTPAGLAPGSETGIPTLLGAPPAEPVARGAVEAAAAGVEAPPGTAAWRVDLHHPDGRRALTAEALLLRAELRSALPHHDVTHLRGHRYLAVGARRPVLEVLGGVAVHVWEDGVVPERVLDHRTVIVAAPGAAAGCGRLMGARVVMSPGATGDVGSDLVAKTRAALAALREPDVRTVVVHVGGADEAAHHQDRLGKRAMIEAADADVVGPLARAAREAGAVIAVTSDHATCVETGRHDAEPVPLVVAGPGVAPSGPVRLHERLVARGPVWDAPFAPLRLRREPRPQAGGLAGPHRDRA
jgi:2,3-bisphosphoglycerate-independent phosphoglycerate mutase